MSKPNLTEKHEKIGFQSQIYENRILHDKVAIIFGAGGATGSQVAREFSKEGATVFLSGRYLSSVEIVAKEIQTSHGKAEAAEVDALNERVVTAYLDNVVKHVRRLSSMQWDFNRMSMTMERLPQNYHMRNS